MRRSSASLLASCVIGLLAALAACSSDTSSSSGASSSSSSSSGASGAEPLPGGEDPVGNGGGGGGGATICHFVDRSERCFETTTRCSDPSFTSSIGTLGGTLVNGSGCARGATWIGCCQSKGENPQYIPPVQCLYEGNDRGLDTAAWQADCTGKEGTFEGPPSSPADAGPDAPDAG